jgi:hypothetical protein
MSGHAYALAMAALEVNGPEDASPDWGAIPWRHHEDNVRRLRQRIFKATREQDYKTVRNLQRMMLRSGVLVRLVPGSTNEGVSAGVCHECGEESGLHPRRAVPQEVPSSTGGGTLSAMPTARPAPTAEP